MLPEDELLGRLASLYSPERAEEIRVLWATYRRNGSEWRVEEARVEGAETEEKAPPAKKFRISQVIRATLKVFRGGYIGEDRTYIAQVKALLPRNFPRVGIRSLKRCEAFQWVVPIGDKRGAA